MARIVVSGWVTGFPTALFFWHAAGFAVGFRDLGHDVWFLEDSGDEPWCYNPRTEELDATGRYGSQFLAAEMSRIGMNGRWVYRHMSTGRHDGMTAEETLDVLASADVLVNVSLTTPMRPEYLLVPHRLGIDTDPVFTQVRMAKGDPLLSRVPDLHTRLFTFGRPPLPAQRHEWVPTRQAVATRFWPVSDHPGLDAPFTTITTWQAYPPVVWEGIQYAAKDRAMQAILDLPQQSPWQLAIGLGAGRNHESGVQQLHEHGWQVIDPIEVTHNSEVLHRFLAASAGEISAAKHGYVLARSGWFSERTCAYLACGRPAVVADTGWRDWLPDGDGLLAYSTAHEAAAALEDIRSDPIRHAEAARKLVVEHFEAADVCATMLEAL